MEPMKNGLAKPAVQRMASALEQLLPDFERKKFTSRALKGLDKLELKERVSHLIEVLHGVFPPDFIETAVLLKQLPAAWNYGNPDDAFRGFAAWPFIDYVGVHGLSQPEAALDTLKELTSMFSAEFAIRPFLIAHPEICQKHLDAWVNNEDDHLRRLVSEGTRPRLPWGMQLKPFIIDPSPNLPLLEILKDDDSLYVRRSVANHLNDIAKDHPDLVIDICKRWYTDASPEVHWVIKHATRTLVKAGHPDVFPLLGYSTNLQLAKLGIQLTKDRLQLGEPLNFEIALKSTSANNQKMVIDFAIHFVKANGLQKAKVFKLKSVDLAPHQTLILTKSHPIKPISTRKYYSGKHKLEILANGKSLGCYEFLLDTEQ
ncbi:MAG: hypothetical protein V7711_07785 [Pseudomonadales bacterium]